MKILPQSGKENSVFTAILTFAQWHICFNLNRRIFRLRLCTRPKIQQKDRLKKGLILSRKRVAKKLIRTEHCQDDEALLMKSNARELLMRMSNLRLLTTARTTLNHQVRLPVARIKILLLMKAITKG